MGGVKQNIFGNPINLTGTNFEFLLADMTLKSMIPFLVLINLVWPCAASASSYNPLNPEEDPKTNLPAVFPTEAVESLGVSVHCFKPGQGTPLLSDVDLDLIQQAGFRWVRMDVLWSEVEKKTGVLDFGKYDVIVQGLLRRGLQPMIILGLGNPLYSDGPSIQNPVARAAFEHYALETVAHFKGLGVLYELVNEPNHDLFWKPKPDPREYMAMAANLLPRLRQLDNTAHFVAPSTSGAPKEFLEACFQAGLLNWVDGVTIHPYQTFYKTPPYKRSPEAVEQEMRNTRALIEQYAPQGKKIPILLGEWGYSSIPDEVDGVTQANFLERQALLGMLYGSPVNIWYDWKGNIFGTYNPSSKNDNFGLVQTINEPKGKQLATTQPEKIRMARNSPALKPKPAYFAMQVLSRELKGKTFRERLPSQKDDYLLVFLDRAGKRTLAAWTTGTSHSVSVEGKPFLLTGKPSYSLL